MIVLHTFTRYFVSFKSFFQRLAQLWTGLASGPRYHSRRFTRDSVEPEIQAVVVKSVDLIVDDHKPQFGFVLLCEVRPQLLGCLLFAQLRGFPQNSFYFFRQSGFVVACLLYLDQLLFQGKSTLVQILGKPGPGNLYQIIMIILFTRILAHEGWPNRE